MDPITGFYDSDKDVIVLEIDMLSILEKNNMFSKTDIPT